MANNSKKNETCSKTDVDESELVCKFEDNIKSVPLRQPQHQFVHWFPRKTSDNLFLY